MARRKESACCGASDTAASKQEQILDAARAVFLEQGYAAASMDNVATRAGVSKATIYAHFTSKDRLFGAVIRSRCDRQFSAFDLPEDKVDDPRAALRQIGLHVLELILSPESLAIYRVVIAEAPRLPELGEAFYHAGPAMGRAKVGAYLTGMNERGLMDVPDPHQAADLFFGMLKGNIHMRGLLGMPVEQHEIEEIADSAARMMLAAFPPRRD